MISPIERLIRYNRNLPFEKTKALLYCTERGKPIIGLLSEEFPSFLIGGQSGFGKTSCMCAFCCNVVMAGGRLIVIDPHINAPRDSLGKAVAPLAPWFSLPILDFHNAETEEVVSYFQYILDEYEARKRPNGTIGKHPLFLVVDEWNELIDGLDDDELETVLYAVRTVARGGRKYGMWVALAAQQWNLDATGGAQIRKNVPGRISFNAELSDIAMLIGTRDHKTLKDLCTPSLGKGEAILKRPGTGFGMQRVRFPYSEVKACQAIADIMQRVYPEYSDYSGVQTAITTFTPAQVHQSVDKSMNIQPVQPTGSNSELSNDGLNDVDMNLNIQSLNLNNKDLRITESEFKLIVEEGNRQLAETGRVLPTLIQKNLNANSHFYRKIKAVCDLLGWHRGMNKKELTAQEKEEVKARYNYTCQDCGATGVPLEVDHKWPRALGGDHQEENLTALCGPCNKKKGSQPERIGV